MTDSDSSFLLPASSQPFSNKQRLFIRYFTAILIDLVVLNLFVEYSEHVVIDSFTISLFAALLLQVLLKLTLAIEHRVAAYFKARQGGFAKFMRYLSAWLLVFGSKFVILEALDIAVVAFDGVGAGVATATVEQDGVGGDLDGGFGGEEFCDRGLFG